MKLSSMILILIIIQGVILISDQVYDATSYELEAYNDNETSIWNFAADPTGWNASFFIIVLLGLGVTASAFIIVGVFTNTPSDVAIFSPIFTMLIAAGMLPIISLYHVFTRELTMFGCTAMPCTPAIVAWLFTGGLLAVFYILSVLEWWPGRGV